MANYIVRGGKPLSGKITVNAGKNSPVALLCSSLLIRGSALFTNMTRVEEVERILEILRSIGVIVEWRGEHELYIDTSPELTMGTIDRHACEVTRSSLLLIGALAAREKQFKIYKSGGCKLGKRSIRPHTMALEEFGISVVSEDTFYDVSVGNLSAAHIVMYESGDTATENAIFAAVLAPGETIIRMASSNYMVQDVCYFLKKAGAKIEGIGTTTLRITGVEKLNIVDAYTIMPDPVDAMAWISLAITTKSSLTIADCPLDFLELELSKLSVMGQKFTLSEERMSHNGYFRLVDITIIPSPLQALPDKLYGRPFPGLNIDNVPLFVPILTQAKGTTLVHDWCYENRALYALEFQKLGAQAMLLDPHRVLIEGPSDLQGNEVMAPPALRPAMAILIAMIAAEGRSVLRNVYQIERGYEKIIERLQSVGVDIERVD